MMNVLIYSAKDFESRYLLQANSMNHVLTFVNDALTMETTDIAKGHDVVMVFAGDDVSAKIIEKLYKVGVRYIAVRAVGYDNVDLIKAQELGLHVANVPEYSPYAIAEHAIALILALNRKLILADEQVHDFNFTVDDLVGFDLHEKSVGVIGTGKIGSVLVEILHGFGCNIMAHDVTEDRTLIEKHSLQYVDLKTLCRTSDIIVLCIPLTVSTKYLINKNLIDEMQTGVMLINTSRGGVINTRDVIDALMAEKLGYVGLDVYENEKGIFFYDHSAERINDEMLKELLSYPNVIITPHQAFATKEALSGIAETTFYNINCWANNEISKNELTNHN